MFRDSKSTVFLRDGDDLIIVTALNYGRFKTDVTDPERQAVLLFTMVMSIYIFEAEFYVFYTTDEIILLCPGDFLKLWGVVVPSLVDKHVGKLLDIMVKSAEAVNAGSAEKLQEVRGLLEEVLEDEDVKRILRVIRRFENDLRTGSEEVKLDWAVKNRLGNKYLIVTNGMVYSETKVNGNVEFMGGIKEGKKLAEDINDNRKWNVENN
jgi:translation elongation factor EF-G